MVMVVERVEALVDALETQAGVGDRVRASELSLESPCSGWSAGLDGAGAVIGPGRDARHYGVDDPPAVDEVLVRQRAGYPEQITTSSSRLALAEPFTDWPKDEVAAPTNARRSWRSYAAASLDDIERDAGAMYSLRWILIHLIEEYARHCGQADLIRQAIDGATGD